MVIIMQSFNFPSIDHLIEGVHYKIVDWSFAENAPNHTPGMPCPPGHKMTFGVCRKVGGSGDSDEEKTAKEKAAKAGSTASNNKAVESGGKKYGWAVKGGKPVLVEWGSVAGIKKQDGTVEKKTREGEGQTFA